MARRKKRKIRRKNNNLVSERASYYSIRVNPDSKTSNLRELEAEGQPILEDWFQKDILKEMILRAVISYAQTTDQKVDFGQEIMLPQGVEIWFQEKMSQLFNMVQSNQATEPMLAIKDDDDEFSHADDQYFSQFLFKDDDDTI